MHVLRPGVRGPLVHAAGTDVVLRALDRRLLTADERRRCARLRQPADRDARMAAHLLVRWSAAQLTGQSMETLEIVQRCPSCGSADHGRPSVASLPAVHVSFARTRGAVVAAAGWDPVGVDVESARPRERLGDSALSLGLTDAEIARVQSAQEPAMAFLRHWTLKECLVKAGVATLDTLPRVELDLSSTGRTTDGRSRTRYGSLHLLDWFDPGLDAVVAAAGARPPVVGHLPVDGRPVADRT
jgi:4'-phosphopantetheinyl transferase